MSAGARWYSAQFGRFLQPDPVEPIVGDTRTLDPYMYTLNNPLAYSDPTGACIPDITCNGAWKTTTLVIPVAVAWAVAAAAGAAAAFIGVCSYYWCGDYGSVDIDLDLGFGIDVPCLKPWGCGSSRSGTVGENTLFSEGDLEDAAEGQLPEIIAGEHVEDQLAKRGWSVERVIETV